MSVSLSHYALSQQDHRHSLLDHPEHHALTKESVILPPISAILKDVQFLTQPQSELQYSARSYSTASSTPSIVLNDLDQEQRIPVLLPSASMTSLVSYVTEQQRLQLQYSPSPKEDPSVSRNRSNSSLHSLLSHDKVSSSSPSTPPPPPPPYNHSVTGHASLRPPSSQSLESTSRPTSPIQESNTLTQPVQETKNPRKYKCKTCEKFFTTSGHLARHSRIHTGERKHVCPFPNCDARFARHDNCMQHHRTHKNLKNRKKRVSKK